MSNEQKEAAMTNTTEFDFDFLRAEYLRAYQAFGTVRPGTSSYVWAVANVDRIENLIVELFGDEGLDQISNSI